MNSDFKPLTTLEKVSLTSPSFCEVLSDYGYNEALVGTSPHEKFHLILEDLKVPKTEYSIQEYLQSHFNKGYMKGLQDLNLNPFVLVEYQGLDEDDKSIEGFQIFSTKDWKDTCANLEENVGFPFYIQVEDENFIKYEYPEELLNSLKISVLNIGEYEVIQKFFGTYKGTFPYLGPSTNTPFVDLTLPVIYSYGPLDAE